MSSARKRLLTTGELAKALSLSDRTLQRYRKEGWIKPALVTPTGHARWDEDEVREQMAEMYRRSREQDPES
ncbi:helix-turn-helix domain-containing protein [Pseudonocardia humida]|uniref:MerR family transcriptional regulator n=1 Tax=Pseudonocardia humida TaxID=2800819 RepID=A0ABT1A3N3_9PSEU|nr:helix-turn-helix domain-containing protein [Pseudonocardia humida]MCO1657593.1 MerR family transcriptional regulator [Pseudonocardia humida]